MFWVCETLSNIPLGKVFGAELVYLVGLLMRKFGKVSSRLSFSPKYCRAVAKNSLL